MEQPSVTPSKKLVGEVEGLYAARKGSFLTEPVEALDLTFDGIPGDIHAGATRKSGAREPWYPRGTEIRNERQITILSRAELSEAAGAMGIEAIEPEWIGANMTLSGIALLSMLPASTLLFFEGGATLKVDFQNGPCAIAGKSIARQIGREGDADLALAFVPAAKRRRGLLAWVEKPGRIQRGERVRARLPEQWIYPA